MSEVGVIHRRRSLAEVQALVAEFETSGLLRAAFCQQRGLAIGRWINIVNAFIVDGSREAGLLFPSKWFLHVRDLNGFAGRDGALVVELRSGRRIEVCRGFDAGTLERLLTILDRM